MAITKRIEEDKIEIVGKFKHVQVRTATIIEEDGVELSRSFHRHTIRPGQDYSNESTEVRNICSAVHTTDIINSYNDAMAQT